MAAHGGEGQRLGYSIYAAESMGLDVLPTVDDAVSWTNDLIARIAGATEAGCEAGL